MAIAPSRRVKHLLRGAALGAALLALTTAPVTAQTGRLSGATFSSADLTQVATDARTGAPTFLAGSLRAAASGTPDAVARQFLAENRSTLGLSARDELVTRSVETDDLGRTHVRLQQTVGGVPVFGGDVAVHLTRDGAVYAYSGHLRADAAQVTSRPALDAAGAIARARAELHMAAERPADDLNDWRPDAHLAVYPTEAGAVLAYHVRLYQDAPYPANWELFVDATTGAVVERWNAIHTVAPLSPFVAAAPATEALAFVDAFLTPVNGTGSSLYSGTVTIQTDRVSSTSYRLYDTTRPSGGIRTRDGRNGTSLPGSDITDADNNFTATAARAGVDAHWGAARVYDYYLSAHGRNSYNNAGAALNSTVHHRSGYNNAFWNGSQMVYGDGDGRTFSSLVDLDICAHELTHAVTERTAGLVYNREPGALNEAVSDIFAAMVDRDDWMVGEKSYTPGTAGDALRYLDNPTRGGQPDTYADRLYAGSCSPTQNNDYCGVHSNSGIPNHAAYLMAAGGTKGGVTVSAIGRDATEDIWYRALTQYFTSTTDFAGARAGTIQAAADLYGAGSTQATQVANAWAAVGVGSAGGGGTPPPPTGQWYYVAQTYDSPHNYPNNYNATNTYTKAGASRVAMYFAQFATEANYDYVYIRDAANATVASHTGSKAAFWAIADGTTIRANLVSDYSVTGYGYRVSQVAYFATAPLAPGDQPMAVPPTDTPAEALATAGDASGKGIETGLELVRPNPSSADGARVAFGLAEAGAVRVAVVDVLGREVLVLHDGAMEAGTHTRPALGLAPGTYLVVLQAAGQRFTQPMTVVR